jgi:hypothetical protein
LAKGYMTAADQIADQADALSELVHEHDGKPSPYAPMQRGLEKLISSATKLLDRVLADRAKAAEGAPKTKPPKRGKAIVCPAKEGDTNAAGYL